MVRVGIVGGSGYGGVELLRLLLAHPQVEIGFVAGQRAAGDPIEQHFTHLRGWVDLSFCALDDARWDSVDLVIFAAPSGVAMQWAPVVLEAGARVIDLSGDFRLVDAQSFAHWYGCEHSAPALLQQAVYGLPELNRQAIVAAALVANPGCYPTAITLGFLPLLEAGIVDCTRLIADAKSGISGAGRNAHVHTQLSESADNFRAYAVAGHRHQPEIVQTLSHCTTDQIGLTFVPHLVPMIRGLHATLYAELSADIDPQALYERRFADEPFVDVMPAGTCPETRSVRGVNTCRIALQRLEQSNRLVILVVEDNLVKGAAGQAVQNMNIMFGLDERAGLNLIPLVP